MANSNGDPSTWYGFLARIARDAGVPAVITFVLLWFGVLMFNSIWDEFKENNKFMKESMSKSFSEFTASRQLIAESVLKQTEALKELSHQSKENSETNEKLIEILEKINERRD